MASFFKHYMNWNAEAEVIKMLSYYLCHFNGQIWWQEQEMYHFICSDFVVIDLFAKSKTASQNIESQMMVQEWGTIIFG